MQIDGKSKTYKLDPDQTSSADDEIPNSRIAGVSFSADILQRPGHHISYATLIQIAAGSMLNGM
jgi:hypothetical protein